MKSRAAAAPHREAVHPTATIGVPQATAIGTPVARTQIFPRPDFPATAGPATLTLDPPAEPSLLVTRPPVPVQAAPRADHPDRAFAVGQVVCWQLAVVAIGVSTTGSRTAIVLTSLASLSLVLLTAVRIRGMWLYRWLGIGLLFALRRRQLNLGTDAGLDLAGLFCGRTTAGAVVVRDQPYGALYRPEGASVALRVDADSRFELLTKLPELADAADEQPVPVTVQLVLHSGVKQNQPSRAWIAIRATRTPEICTNEQLGQILANTVRRLVRRFDREKVESMPLDRTDLPASIAALAHANAGRGQLRERWTRWSAGPVQQTAVRLTGTTSLPPATVSALAATLLGTGTGAAQTLAVAVTTAPGAEASRHEAVFRLAASHPATLDTALTVLTTLAKSFGTEPDRLDGRHADGVAATLPLGVPLS